MFPSALTTGDGLNRTSEASKARAQRSLVRPPLRLNRTSEASKDVALDFVLQRREPGAQAATQSHLRGIESRGAAFAPYKKSTDSIAPQRHRKLWIMRAVTNAERTQSHLRGIESGVLDHHHEDAPLTQSHLRGIERRPMTLHERDYELTQSHLRGIERWTVGRSRPAPGGTQSHLRGIERMSSGVSRSREEQTQSHLRGIERSC